MTIAVLAGGEGSRMGRAKGELRVGGVPILAYLHERLRECGRMILITAPGREKPPGAEKFGAEFVDPIAGRGPMRGVLTALENAADDIVVVTTIDMPEVSPLQVRWLREQLSGRSDALGLLLRRGDDQVEPFPSAYRISAADVLRQRIATQRRFVRGLLDDRAFVLLPAPDQWSDDVWTNLNTPADYDAFMRRSSCAGR